MRVLVIFECSDTVADAFKAKGHNVRSCDLKPSEHNRPDHLQCDFRDLDYTGVDLVIAHPDCARLANSGVRWLHERPELWDDFMGAVRIFNVVLDLNVPRLVVENPIQHKYARQYIRKYDQIIQPYQFGEPYTKATCLWLQGVKPLIPTKIIPKSEVIAACHLEPPSPERKANRARTYKGIAQGMAEQWG